MEKVTYYKTKDGKTFDTESEAIYHESLITLRKHVGDICSVESFQFYKMQDDGIEELNLDNFIVENRYSIYETLKEFYDRVHSLNSEPREK